MLVITFRVYGVPKPGGSKKGFFNKKLGRVMIVDDSKHIKTWRGEVKDAAIDNAPDKLLQCPLQMSVVFFMPRPKAHYRTGKHQGKLKENAPHKHIKMPDALKLMRGTEDAMTGIIYKDDCIIWDEHQRKVYDERPGAQITIEWEEEDNV